jgi:hypothetical protein
VDPDTEFEAFDPEFILNKKLLLISTYVLLILEKAFKIVGISKWKYLGQDPEPDPELFEGLIRNQNSSKSRIGIQNTLFRIHNTVGRAEFSPITHTFLLRTTKKSTEYDSDLQQMKVLTLY